MKYELQKPISASIAEEKYAMTVSWRNGKFVSDEPETSGGKDTGPDPYTLLLSSVATCVLATLRMYIDRKELNIPNISVNCNMFIEKREGKSITVIDRDINYHQELTEEEYERLNDIADKCPVSKILKGDIVIRTFTYRPEPIEKEIHYSNDDITVTWKGQWCKHSGRCIFGLPEVFDVNAHPWINMQGASTDEIIQQVNLCPTGALSYKNKNK